MMEALRLLDQKLSGRALIFGSTPPEGRDLDLLIEDHDANTARDALAAAGFRSRGATWTKVSGCSVEVVDLVAAGSWELPADQVEGLFAEASAFDDHQRVVVPSPYHSLLILARRLQQDGLKEKHLERVLAAERSGVSVWDHAAARATAWDAHRGLTELRRARDRGKLPKKQSVSLPLRRPRVLVALQGMDGSGKSSLAEALADMVRTLGHEPIMIWNRLAVNPSLDLVAVPIKRLMRPFVRRKLDTSDRPEIHGADDEPPDPGTMLRRRSTFLTQIWTCFVALWNAVSHRRSAQPHLIRGRIVISDRYLLDSAVNLRFGYGPEHSFRFQKWIIATLSPKPTLSFHLRVPADVAHRRKPEKFTLEELGMFERLYDEERTDRVICLDATLPREQLCEAIGWALWEALP